MDPKDKLETQKIKKKNKDLKSCVVFYFISFCLIVTLKIYEDIFLSYMCLDKVIEHLTT